MEFTIDAVYLTDVTVKTEFNPFKDKQVLTPDELVNALKWENNNYTISAIDHPQFTELRETLEHGGYIHVQRNWWNGDVVRKPFTLNGFKFSRGNRFPCAAALGVAMRCAEARGSKSLPLL
jgi:hypothetical protein